MNNREYLVPFAVIFLFLAFAVVSLLVVLKPNQRGKVSLVNSYLLTH